MNRWFEFFPLEPFSLSSYTEMMRTLSLTRMCGINVFLCLVSVVILLWVLLKYPRLAPCERLCRAALSVLAGTECRGAVTPTGRPGYKHLSGGLKRAAEPRGAERAALLGGSC